MPAANPIVEAIRSRRSIRKMKPDQAPTREQVETIIEAATWAPNHYLTEPWRFVVVAGEERNKLGEALTAALASTFPDTGKEKLEMERSKPLSAPVIVAIISSPRADPKVVEREELIAAGAALQNMLLAAHSLGVSSMVRTGAHSYSDGMREYLGLKDGESLVGMVYLGYASESSPLGKRTPHADKTVWRGI